MPRILVVDGSTEVRQTIAQVLDGSGYETIGAGNGLEAVKLAADGKPDLMILELLMPDMDGFDVLTTLKKRGASVPVIVLSADIQETTRQECLRLGAVQFLNKPPETEELLRVVRETLKTE